MKENVNLVVESRELKGKGPAYRFRQSGKLPGVVYGLGKNAPVMVNPKVILQLLLSEGGRNRLLSLTGNGFDGRHAIVKEYQVDPVSRELLHIDLLEIDITKKVEVTVPLHYQGKAQGVSDGGVLNLIERSLKIRCLPTQIPDALDVDVTNLKIGDSIHLESMHLPEGIEKVSHSNLTLVTVVPPTKEEDAAPVLTQAAEPEVITQKKEAAEGEAASKEGAAASGGEKDKKKS